MLIGTDVLGDKQRSVFEVAKILKEYFLLQSAYHPIDVHCPIQKTIKMLKIILKFSEKTKVAIESGVSLQQILTLPIKIEISRLKTLPMDEFDAVYETISVKIDEQFEILILEARKTKEMEEA
jgi:V/A-type H+-transporting ATPase subunit A